MKTRAKKTSTGDPAIDGLSFEQAIARLEKIVEDMEAAELPLDDVLKKYEEGTKLVQFCGLKLDEAEKKIELLTRKADGSVSLKPFQPGESENKEEDENSTDKESRLF